MNAHNSYAHRFTPTFFRTINIFISIALFIVYWYEQPENVNKHNFIVEIYLAEKKQDAIFVFPAN